MVRGFIYEHLNFDISKRTNEDFFTDEKTSN